MSNFMSNLSMGSLLAASAFAFVSSHQGLNRLPSSVEPFELHIQSVAVANAGRVQSLDNVFLRATFDAREAFEFGRGEKLSVAAGENRRLDLKVDVDPRWLHNDELQFSLELVQTGVVENVVFRCTTVAKELSVYNRAYQCTVPGENQPVLSYRLARKGGTETSGRMARADR